MMLNLKYDHVNPIPVNEDSHLNIPLKAPLKKDLTLTLRLMSPQVCLSEAPQTAAQITPITRSLQYMLGSGMTK